MLPLFFIFSVFCEIFFCCCFCNEMKNVFPKNFPQRLPGWLVLVVWVLLFWYVWVVESEKSLSPLCRWDNRFSSVTAVFSLCLHFFWRIFRIYLTFKRALRDFLFWRLLRLRENQQFCLRRGNLLLHFQFTHKFYIGSTYDFYYAFCVKEAQKLQKYLKILH